MKDAVGVAEKFFGITFQGDEPFDERTSRTPRNWRFELLGDAILKVAVLDILMLRYPDAEPRTLVSMIHVFVSNKEIRKISGPFSANMYETILGALYSDQGFPASRSLVEQTIFDRATEKGRCFGVESKYFPPMSATDTLSIEAKERLGVVPTYQQWRNRGKGVHVGVYFGGVVIADGHGDTMSDAEESAAEAALIVKGWKIE